MAKGTEPALRHVKLPLKGWAQILIQHPLCKREFPLTHDFENLFDLLLTLS